MKYNSRILLSFCLLLTINLSVLAQEPDDHQKRMEKYDNRTKVPNLATQVQNYPKEHGIDGGQLNPDWVEWLMGMPIGWTRLYRDLPQLKLTEPNESNQ